MLVLSRQRNESIMIGDDVEVVIVDVRGDKVRLGITAPKTISVHRKEVYEAIQQEKAEGKQHDVPPVKPHIQKSSTG
jgi:carbon storage regulator